jgi:hypothetical protein
MRIDRRLHLVQTFDTSAGTVHVHSVPLSYEVCRQYFLVLRKTYAQMVTQGLFPAGGASSAVLLMERIARADNAWEGPDGVRDGLMAEIRRLTNVVVPSPNGWQTTPYAQALTQNIFDQEDVDEMEGAIVFFICASLVFRSQNDQQRMTTLLAMMEFQWHTRTTSLGVTEWAASLPISMPAESSGATVPVSSLPH